MRRSLPPFFALHATKGKPNSTRDRPRNSCLKRGHVLYNLKEGIGESIDLSENESAMAEKLDGLLMKTLKAQNAFFPVKNTNQGQAPKAKAPKGMSNKQTQSGIGSQSKKPAGKVENTSENHEFLRGYFNKNPKADQNSDGVLTATEYKKHKADQQKQ